MPTAALPDSGLQSARNTGDLLQALREGTDPDRIWATVMAINGTMPDEAAPDGTPLWRVMVSSSERARRLAEHLLITCPRCGAEHERTKVRIVAMRLGAEERIIASASRTRKTADRWICRTATLRGKDVRTKDTPDAGCGRWSRLDRSEVIRIRHSRDFMCGVIDDPPARWGLGSSRTIGLWRAWAAQAYSELITRLAAYRKAHWHQASDDDPSDVADLLDGHLEAGTDP